MVKCNNGYEYLANQPVCNGSNQVSTCTPVKCAVPNITDGQQTASHISFQQTVTYSCNAHHELVGDAQPTCQADRSLTSTPTCKAFDCLVPVIPDGRPSSSGLNANESAVYSCNNGYFLLGNPSITCNGIGRLSTSETPSCYPSPPTEYRYCQRTSSIIVSSYNRLNYSFASQLCRLYTGMIISTQSVSDGCAHRGMELPLYAWMGLPANNQAMSINAYKYDLDVKLSATCEIPCLPKRYDQMQSTAMPSNISCRYDELSNSRACQVAKGRTSISILGLVTNYTVSLEICRFYNGSILSESSFQAGCASGLTSQDLIAWVGSPDEKGMLSDTAGNKVQQAVDRYVVCDIPVHCSVPTIANGFVNGSEIQWTDRATYSCKQGYGIVGDATPMCTEHGTLSSVPYCRAFDCLVPVIPDGRPGFSGLFANESGVYSCNTGYFLLGNPSITCNGFGRLSTSETPSCYPSPPTKYRYCQQTNSIIVSSYNLLNYSFASQLCRLYTGMIISTQSVSDGCAYRQLEGPLYAWMGLPANNQAMSINASKYDLGVKLYATCEIPCLPKRYDQMQSTAMPSNISCRYDELSKSRACAAAKGRTSISILGLITNYAVSLEICRFYNGSILSEFSFQAGCASGLTSKALIAWVGSPDEKGMLSDTAGNKVHQASDRYVVCDIPVNCSVPTIANGFVNRSEIQWTDRATYSCKQGYGIVGDATPMCTEHGTLSSVPYCRAFDCLVPVIPDGRPSSSGLFANEYAVYSCNTGYFLLGNPSITCNGSGRLSTSEKPSCYPSPPTEYRYCQQTNSIIVSSYNLLNYSFASQLCRLYTGMIISTQSVSDGCADRGMELPLYAWMGLPANNKAMSINAHKYNLNVKLFATCEIPCLPKRYDQMQSTAMPSNISCRYDELSNSRACQVAKGRTSISILGLVTNYTVSLEICRFYNGSILSESSFQAGCASGLTSQDLIAWVGSPDEKGMLSDTAGNKVQQAVDRYIVCDIQTAATSQHFSRFIGPTLIDNT
ncbi:sushi, von Willebrand factor type A, EGF and pentraxin domain-containing protein 1-like [Sycon ciliatum]|uniref:sushi, von Willebrand factor type A, EGF and pentraxin domain-containing protein 1-like n=1 Tax=Sycon ciliatum TaxID=27933 RepID=UPI0031F60B2F